MSPRQGRRQTKPFYVHLRLCPKTACGLVIVDVLQLGTKNSQGTAIVGPLCLYAEGTDGVEWPG